MEVMNIGSIASIDFAEVRISIDELEALEAAFAYASKNLSSADIESKLGATQDEVNGIDEDLRTTMALAKAKTV